MYAKSGTQNTGNVPVRWRQSSSPDIHNCRGQSYDNASAMIRRYNGLQAIAENNFATWIPCAGHSQVVGKAAAECCQAAVAFLDSLE